MKTKSPMNKWIPLAALGLALAGMNAQAVQDYYFGPGATHYATNLFGADQTDTLIFEAHGNWGSGTLTFAYDNTMSPDPANIPGSIKIVYDDPGNSYAANCIAMLSMTQGFQPGWFGDLGGPQDQYNLAAWGAFSFDINVNLNTSSNVDIPLVFMGQNWDKLYPNNAQNMNPNAVAQGFNLVPPITNAGWHHIRIPFTAANTDPTAALFGFYSWCPGGNGTAHLEYNLANLLLEKGPPPVAPTLAAQHLPYEGFLMDFGSATVNASSGVYNRQELWTVATHPWIGATSHPVTYSMNVLSADQGMQVNMFIAPSAKYGNPENNGSNVCWLKIEGQADGTALASVHWKTNSPLSFDMLYAAPPAGGLLGNALAYPSVTGSWSLSFSSDTSFSLTGPGGATHTFNVPQSWIDIWNADGDSTTPGDAYMYCGAETTGSAVAGTVWLSSISTSGDPSPATNNFTDSVLDPTAWAISNPNTSGTTIVNTNSWLFTWTLPALLYDLVGTGQLSSTPAWSDVLSNTIPSHVYIAGAAQRAVVPAVNFPAGPNAFFRLQRTAAYNLLVLLPGETFAPGTPTGKTGTPSPQKVGVPFNVTVKAIQPNNTLQSGCNDALTISTRDTTATFTTPQTLVDGSVTFDFTIGTVGSWWVRAVDTLDNSVDTVGTSVTVTP